MVLLVWFAPSFLYFYYVVTFSYIFFLFVHAAVIEIYSVIVLYNSSEMTLWLTGDALV